MKRVFLMVYLFLFAATSVQALEWAYSFVVWDGNVYEVTEEKVSKRHIGLGLGEVKSKADEYTGKYRGDASNAYPNGKK